MAQPIRVESLKDKEIPFEHMFQEDVSFVGSVEQCSKDTDGPNTVSE